MKGCDRCGHRKKDHYKIQGREGRICLATVGHRACLCPSYLKPGTMR